MRVQFLAIGLMMALFSCPALAETNLTKAAAKAISADFLESEAAIKLLRGKKQAGLDALFEEYSKEIATHSSSGISNTEWNRISYAIDQVAKQKDAYSSRLFWHTSLNEARIEAVKAGKPILSLRLLGNLDEEYSCANSRFFRSILYSDPAIADNLRENFVLHWESVRPAPRITIDFGDGRTLVRTITGNSIHYVLDSKGDIIDTLPGLYAPTVFDEYLTRLSNVSRDPLAGPQVYAKYREETRRFLLGQWNKRLDFLLKTDPKIAEPPSADRSFEITANPSATDAAPLAVTKMAVERPVLDLMARQFERLNAKTGASEWLAIAKLSDPVEISPESIALMRSKTRNLSDREFDALVANTKEYVSIDTAQNDFRFHTTLLSWLNPVTATDLKGFNERVYNELFLTPGRDKWLGLYAPDIYAAIEDNGIQ